MGQKLQKLTKLTNNGYKKDQKCHKNWILIRHSTNVPRKHWKIQEAAIQNRVQKLIFICLFGISKQDDALETFDSIQIGLKKLESTHSCVSAGFIRQAPPQPGEFLPFDWLRREAKRVCKRAAGGFCAKKEQSSLSL